MYVIVSYDISDDKRRFEIMSRLKAMGYVRVQRSLYMARGGSTLAKDTARALMRLMGREDSVV
ncbi:MAG: CRISPR-associated endonuclease Cas2, partial [Vulcanisaeta sp.]|uniref:CRISPR-associated endonuclease Cas2 n=1 Tax=Vulcanisaeta sp. TaxID=2020871 RepID=UPI003D10A2DD